MSFSRALLIAPAFAAALALSACGGEPDQAPPPPEAAAPQSATPKANPPPAVVDAEAQAGAELTERQIRESTAAYHASMDGISAAATETDAESALDKAGAAYKTALSECDNHLKEATKHYCRSQAEDRYEAVIEEIENRLAQSAD
ncbi:MAG: hypothetical protein WCZ65_12530 [Lysobacteraceae bacterium]